MCPSRKGQSTIELAMIVILVVFGIIVAGPYVLRSVNAHFKMWDDAVQDSQDDRLIKDKKTHVHINPPPCTCGWSSGDCGVQGCQKNERAYTKSCDPVGCDPGSYKCTKEDSCCTDPARTNRCWRSPADAPDGGTVFPPGYHACGSADIYTNVKDRVYQYVCGTQGNTQICRQDISPVSVDGDRNCTPACRIDQIPAGGAPCPGYGTTLVDDMDMTMVGPASKCSTVDPGSKCEMYCVMPDYTITQTRVFKGPPTPQNPVFKNSFTICCYSGDTMTGTKMNINDLKQFDVAVTITVECHSPNCTYTPP